MTEQTQPTDAELLAEYDRVFNATRTIDRHGVALRAVLAKWGTPAGAGEVASLVQSAQAFVLDPTSLQKKLHLEAQAWGPLASTPQPTQAQAGAVPLTPFIPAQRERLYYNRPENVGKDASLADWHRIVQYIEAAHGIKGGQHGAE